MHQDETLDATLSYDTDATLDVSQEEDPEGEEPKGEELEAKEPKGEAPQAKKHVAACAGQKRQRDDKVCVRFHENCSFTCCNDI